MTTATTKFDLTRPESLAKFKVAALDSTINDHVWEDEEYHWISTSSQAVYEAEKALWARSRVGWTLYRYYLLKETLKTDLRFNQADTLNQMTHDEVDALDFTLEGSYRFGYWYRAEDGSVKRDWSMESYGY